MLKGRLSKKWGQAQATNYKLNLHTRDSKKYSGDRWTRITIKTFLEYTLESQNTRCNALHGADEAEKLKKSDGSGGDSTIILHAET